MDDLVFLHSAAYPRCRAIVDKRFDGYHTLQFMAEGSLDLLYDEELHALRGPSVWSAYPGPHVRFHLARGTRWWNHRYVAFTGPRVAHWIAEGLWLQTPQTVNRVEKYINLFDDLLQHAERSDSLNRRAAAAVLERILIELAIDRTRESRQSSDVPWLQDVLEEQARKFAPDYDSIADKHGISISTLRRRFLEATGKPIHTAAVEARIARARAALAATDKPIKAIAAELGYADEYFFARQFKSIAGVPPATFRRSRQ